MTSAARLFSILFLLLTCLPAFGGDDRFQIIPTDRQLVESKATAIFQQDDGTFETAFAQTTNGSNTFAMRFDFSSDEDVVEVEHCWLSSGGATTGFSPKVIVYQDPGGVPGASLGSTQAAPFNLPEDLFFCSSTSVRSLNIETDSHNIWVGVEWTNNSGSPGVFVAVDTSGSAVTPATVKNPMSITGWDSVPSIGGFENFKHFGIRLTTETGGTIDTGGSETPSSFLALPYFEVATGSGVVTLFAVRNITNQDIKITKDFALADGTSKPGQVETLKAGATTSVNLGDVFKTGSTVGFGMINVVDSQGNETGVKALVGDYFLVDPANNFAFGDPLPTKLCNRSTARYATPPGVFDGSTFTFGVPLWKASTAPDFDSSTGLAPIAEVKIRDEAGVDKGGFLLLAGLGVDKITTLNITDAGVTLPQFGSLEWTLLNGEGGQVTWSMNAESKFSVGMTGTCLD